ncbi:DNA-binding transcriptional regulator FabR [Pseudomonas fluvialis]|uniref:HTH-type transcriptional repressor FabR n=1 Tax=Pseudomonas fluvialis TaxID=1793966 RepID=A0A2I0CME1_9PSED|nr:MULTISPECIES: HTH-type transcriptional repressor FabR [Pseudomonas]OXM39373.1 DNA-binding transcriptional regulator FabR [Pseudomonas fluvialis]PKF70319.1 HTH-type transcriptional repressor FabR [Pseudomonas pharmacofabricae]GGH95819.1 TetR family transcriptional regulator [Pseudomonas fluvialis]
MSSPRAEQKQQTRQALMEAALSLMHSGRGFGSLSLREVTRLAGVVPTAFYRHFSDMDELGLALVAEVGQTFRATLREVRRNEFELGGLIEASTRIFLDAVQANHNQFLFLAREQYGGSQAVRQALGELRQLITDDLAADLRLMNRLPQLDDAALGVLSDLVVKTVFATLPELIDPPAANLPPHLQPEAKITQQLRFIMIGGKHWQGLGKGSQSTP